MAVANKNSNSRSDPETRALVKSIWLIEPLEEDARIRIVEYLAERYLEGPNSGFSSSVLIPQGPVGASPLQRILEAAGRSEFTDDGGVFRIHGSETGIHLIKTSARTALPNNRDRGLNC